MRTITAQDVQGMVGHWLNTPPNGYLGSDRGCGIKELLQRPLTANEADQLLNKLRRDVPVVNETGATGQVNIFSTGRAPDKLDIVIQASGEFISGREVAQSVRDSRDGGGQVVNFPATQAVFYGFVPSAAFDADEVLALASRDQNTALGTYALSQDGLTARFPCIAFPRELPIPLQAQISGFTYQFERQSVSLFIDGIPYRYIVLRLPAKTAAAQLFVEFS